MELLALPAAELGRRIGCNLAEEGVSRRVPIADWMHHRKPFKGTDL